jgi:GNAT superfamily N-acetyltransferase
MKEGVMMLIREAHLVDAEGIAKVNVASWKTTYVGIVPADFLTSLSYEQRIPSWQARLSDSTKDLSHKDWSYYVAEDDKGEIIGFIGGGTESNSNSVYTAELGVLYLLKSYQRKGIGRRLTAILTQRLIKQGHHSMLVWTFASNPSRKFYEVLGGKLIGEKTINISGANLVEVGYGWDDLPMLLSQDSSFKNQFDSN